MNCNVCHKPESEHKDGLFCCPFCGGEAELFMQEDWGGDSYPTSKCTNYYELACMSTSCPGASELSFSTAEEAIAAWNRRASGWIACAERMPKRGALLLFCADRGVYEGHRDESGQGWQFRYGWLADNVVTHWMPLPAPPEVEP